MSAKAYREAHRAETAARNKMWREANRERIAQYRETHSEQAEAYRKRRYVTHHEAYLAAAKKYAAAHREERNEYGRKWRTANPEHVKAHAVKVRSIKADQRLRRKYGITLAERDALFEVQGSGCAICKASKPGGKYGWSLDHDHDSRDVRGILCHACNLALGFFKDDIELLDAAIVYLVRSRRPKLKIVGGQL